MPAYRFEALDAAGKPSTGLVEADNARAARAQLRAQSLVPLQVTPVSAATAQGGGRQLFTRRVFSSTALSVWTRQLAGLVGAGLPLERALTALADEAEDPKQRELVAHLRAEVNAGAPFARALAGSPHEFDDVYRAVVAAGEQSGALGTVLERLADDLEERQELRGRLMLAMLAGAGVPILKALQAAAETLSNRAMRADAMEALVQVREGAPLASALAAKKRFPGLLAMFARLGEQTGQLPQMLARAAQQLG